MTTGLDQMRADWADQDVRLLATVENLADRTAHVLTAPGLPAPVAELARIVGDLLALVRDQIVDDYTEDRP